MNMIISAKNNILNIGGEKIELEHNIETVIQFDRCCIVLFSDDKFSIKNNISAYDFQGNKLWQISEIIPFKFDEVYIYLSKMGDTQFITASYNGIRYTVDVITRQVISKQIIK